MENYLNKIEMMDCVFVNKRKFMLITYEIKKISMKKIMILN